MTSPGERLFPFKTYLSTYPVMELCFYAQGESVIHSQNRNSTGIGERVQFVTYSNHRIVKNMIGDEQVRYGKSVSLHEVSIFIDRCAIYL